MILFQFLLTDYKSENLVQTLLKIRNAINTLFLSSNGSEDQDSCKTVIFQELQKLSLSSKNLSEAWLNMISTIKTASEHKPIDYLILFMLHHTIQLKRKIIEAIFKKRVLTGLFNINHLEKMFEKCLLGQLMKEYFYTIVEIGKYNSYFRNTKILTI